MNPIVKAFFDPDTFTASFVVSDPASGSAAIIDAVLNFDYAPGRTSTGSADAIIDYLRENALTAQWILETHVHADHLSAAAYLKERLGGKTGIGSRITLIQQTFGEFFNEGPDFKRDGSQFDHLFQDGEQLPLGTLQMRVLCTPGHTPACVTYVIGDAAFVGDTLFMPDYGTARCDFPGGSAATMYDSVQKILALPDATRIFVGHDYKAEDREQFAWESTVAEQRAQNIHVRQGTTREDFIKLRNERDARLAAPRLILPSLQVNMRAGELPPAASNGTVYLKIPVNRI